MTVMTRIAHRRLMRLIMAASISARRFSRHVVLGFIGRMACSGTALGESLYRIRDFTIAAEYR